MHRFLRTDWLFIATVCVLAVAIALRIAAAFQPLWLDEVWSLAFADRMVSPWDIFRIHHLNNHPLNTLYLWLLGYGRPPVVYRIPSLVSGIVLLLWMTRDAWKRSHREGFFVALLIGFSLVILQTAAEARGYSPMLLSAYAAYVCFQRMERTGGQCDMVLYALFGSLAIALHLSAITLILSASAATFTRVCIRSGFVQAVFLTFRRHGVPFLLFGLLVVFTLHHEALDMGLDPGMSFWVFGVQVLGWTELPRTIAMVFSFGMYAALLSVVERTLRNNPPEGMFLLMLFCIAPAFLLLCGSRAIGLEVRFFLPSVAAFFLVLSALFARAWRFRPILSRIALVTLFAVLLLGNSEGIGKLMFYGRAESKSFQPVLQQLQQQSALLPVTFGMEYSIDVILVEFFGTAADFVFIPRERWSTTPPEWLLGRRNSWESVRQDFLERMDDRYTMVMPSHEGRWWTVWRRKDL